MNTTHLFRAGSAALMLAVSLSAAAYSPPDYFSITRLDVQANDIAANPIGGTVLATLPSAAGLGLGNTLARFDPGTGALRGLPAGGC